MKHEEQVDILSTSGHAKGKVSKIMQYCIVMTLYPNGLSDTEAAELVSKRLGVHLSNTDIYRYRTQDIPGIIQKRKRDGNPVKGKYIWVPTHEWQTFAEAILKLAVR